MKFVSFFMIAVLVMNSTVPIMSKTENVEVLSQAFAEIINTLSFSHYMKFEIIATSESEEMKWLINEILKKVKYPAYNHFCIVEKNCTLYFNSPAIVLMERDIFKSWFVFEKSKPFINGTSTYKVERLTSTYVDTAWIVYTINDEIVQFEDLFQLYFQIFHSKINENNLILKNYVLQTRHSCHSTWRIVNKFSSKKLSWVSNSFLTEYNKYHNCPIYVARTDFIQNDLDLLNGIYSYKTDEHGKKTFSGIFIELLKVFEEVHEAQIRDFFQDQIRMDIVLMFENLIEPTIFNFIHKSYPLSYFYCTFLVTPGYEYNHFEKLILPYDIPTWIGLVSVILATFISIFIIYQCPQKTRDFIFGKKVLFPSLGSLQIFFGLGYVHVAETNFGRIVFIAFTLFCLVIRTAYQGKMFDFMITEVRHPMPHTVEELFDSNIEIVDDGFGNIDLLSW